MKIAVLLSGGVDSSVALCKLILKGYTDITAFYLKIWLEDDTSFLGSCPWDEDISYAQSVCEKFNIAFKIIPMQTQYYEKVVSYVIDELKQGRTPSPDIFCNQRIKFGAFFDFLKDDYDVIASGHYGIIENDGFRFRLFRAVDEVKDQSYFLSSLSQKQLSKIIFPIGDMKKEDVRKLAKDLDLPNKIRKDSQGICFLGKIKYKDFVRYYLGEKQGDIVDIETKKVLGSHDGFWFYTIGQRTGLKLGGPDGPYYVCKKDSKNNIIYVSNKLQSNQVRFDFDIKIPNWINEPDNIADDFFVKIRHGKHLLKAKLQVFDDRINVKIPQGDSGISLGQFCIIYQNRECLGNGMIVR